MYSFGPLPKLGKSGRHVGVHQKIDRVARRYFRIFEQPELKFPGIVDILHFEGIRGPDGIKIKSPGVDEPWHFVDPKNPSEQFLGYVRNHSDNLVRALAAQDIQRAAFEAAWLAHVVTDGLTPAHHEPLGEQIEQIRGDAGMPSSVHEKIVMPGDGSAKQFVRNNWQYWGAGGAMTSHMMYEAGVATAVKPLKFNNVALPEGALSRLETEGFEPVYVESIQYIDDLQMFAMFKNSGWTHRLAQLTTHELIPEIIRMVILAWYDAYQRALREAKL